MNSISQVIRHNKPALLFLAKFVGLYLLLNIIYGLYIESFKPGADPITYIVSVNSASILSIAYDSEVSVKRLPETAFIDLQMQNYSFINVFEGCNSVNVLIVFFVFVLAFSGSWYRHWVFLIAAALSIYAINLVRVTLLFVVADKFPDSLYFFHKFLFTGIIYAWVFVLWYFWVKKFRSREPGTANT